MEYRTEQRRPGWGGVEDRLTNVEVDSRSTSRPQDVNQGRHARSDRPYSHIPSREPKLVALLKRGQRDRLAVFIGPGERTIAIRRERLANSGDHWNRQGADFCIGVGGLNGLILALATARQMTAVRT